jgi:hypothetical protein
MGIVIDFLRERFDQARANWQPPGPVRKYGRLESRPERKIPLFGSDSGFGEDYADYRSHPPGVQGAINPGVPRFERENLDGVVDLEKWQPDSSVPKMPSHGRGLDYSHETDQRPISSFRGEMSNKPITLSVEAKKDFQGVRKTSGPTVGDLHTLDLKSYPFDFSV